MIWQGQSVALATPDEFDDTIRFVLRGLAEGEGEASHLIAVDAAPAQIGRFRVTTDGVLVASAATGAEAVRLAVDELVRCLITGVSSGVVLHAGCVSWQGSAVLLAGASGAGKSSLTAWLSEHRFAYQSDEAVVLLPDVPKIAALPRPIVLKNADADWLNGLNLGDGALHRIGNELLAWPSTTQIASEPSACRLCLFPRYEPGAALRLKPMSPADCALALTGLNVNARNLADHGFATVISFARIVAGFALSYSDFSQLTGIIETLADLALHAEGPEALARLFAAVGEKAPETSEAPQAVGRVVTAPADTTLPPTPAIIDSSARPVMTIGMATYDDYDGLYFTVQAVRLYHPEIVDKIEFVVVDNNPRGACAQPLKQLERDVARYRYVPYEAAQTNAVKTVVFEEASADLVLCIDSHVLIVPGALARLIDYAAREGGERDFWQGPLVYDDLSHISTHLTPQWRGGMFGCWATDERGLDPDAPPFEIGMQGMGLFACRRQAWPGFNPLFKGFAVEEGYTHEKIRRAGGRVYCLPFLRWLHRFNRPFGIPYPNIWEERIRNYLIGHHELGLDTQQLEQHFLELLGPKMEAAIHAAKAEIAACAEVGY